MISPRTEMKNLRIVQDRVRFRWLLVAGMKGLEWARAGCRCDRRNGIRQVGWETSWVAYNHGHDVALPGLYPNAETGGELANSLDPTTFARRSVHENWPLRTIPSSAELPRDNRRGIAYWTEECGFEQRRAFALNLQED